MDEKLINKLTYPDSINIILEIPKVIKESIKLNQVRINMALKKYRLREFIGQSITEIGPTIEGKMIEFELY
ncbi:MAG: hypothetical protein R2804_08485 [Cyclobacteriaceae bacterium]